MVYTYSKKQNFMKNFMTWVVGFLLITTRFLDAQTLDTVSIGAGYSQQVWYKLETDKEVKSIANNWDLAFSTRINRDAAISINPNVSLYKAVAPASAWANLVVDTLTLTPEKQQFNADTVWNTGAFNVTGDNVFNYGWGNYNIISHNVVGDSIYILKTLSGAWKKILIEKLAYDTSYFFKYADLNGTNEKSFELKKKDFTGKNFGYFSFSTDNTINREPLSKDWDLTFLRFMGLTPDPTTGNMVNYPLTGVLSSDDVKVAKIRRDTSNDKTEGLNFQTRINVIGADWKNFDQAKNVWKLLDSTAYFIKTPNGKIFKLIFTGFGGSANGNMIFTREDIKAITSLVDDSKNSSVAALGIYPNPVTDGAITLVYELGKTQAQTVDIQLFNLAGQSLFNKKAAYTEGVQQFTLPTLNLNTGLYFARISWEGKMLTQKIMVH
jgi:Secretion system C-terminal sorting domain